MKLSKLSLLVLTFMSTYCYSQVAINGASNVIEKNLKPENTAVVSESVTVTKSIQKERNFSNQIVAPVVNYSGGGVPINISKYGASTNIVKPINAALEQESFSEYSGQIIVVTEKPQRVTSSVREEYTPAPTVVVATPITEIKNPGIMGGVVVPEGVLVNNLMEEVDIVSLTSSSEELGTIYFSKNSVEVDKSFYKELSQTLIYLRANPNATLVLSGYTDVVGGESYSSRLSERRVSEVYRLLTEVFKIPSIKLEKFFLVDKLSVPNLGGKGIKSAEGKVSIRIL